ncbi:MAG: hypothetical protein IJ757_05675 [Clostridiales bacterium]|nr:hypothetical protein [Clostridiales bacterium]
MKKKTLLTLGIAILMVSAYSCRASQDPNPEEAPETSVTTAEVSEVTVETTILPTDTPSPTPTEAVEPVVDVNAPFFLSIIRDAYLPVGEEFDINNYMSYIDDFDPDVTLTVGGSVDPYAVGTYPLPITITDDAGNSSSDSVTVHVYEPDISETTQDYSGGGSYSGTAFSDFIASYSGDDVHYGIDVSHWQGNIDFEAVRNAGCEFVIIRAGWSSGGQFHEDDYFETNIEAATEAGLPVGVYVYTSDNSIEDVVNLADIICSMTEGYELRLPIVFDWESFGKFQQYSLSIADLNALYRAFASRIEENGRQSILYSSKYFLEIIWDDDLGPVWLAHYTSQTDYDGPYTIWQQSNTGLIDGIDAYVDMDLYYGDLTGGPYG